MTNEEYIKNAVRTEAPITGETEDRVKKYLRALHGAMGLCTESGELIDMLKKHFFYDKDMDTTNIFEELGDVIWYFAELCDVFDFKIEDIMERNVAKLKQRYPQRFTSDKAINRDLEAEREVLETLSDEMKIAKGMLDNEIMPRHPHLKRVQAKELPLPGIQLTKPTSPIVHKEIPYKPLKTPLQILVNLVEKFGIEHVLNEAKQFNEDFYKNMNRDSQQEDIDLFYYRWWKSVVRQEKRPVANVKSYEEMK